MFSAKTLILHGFESSFSEVGCSLTRFSNDSSSSSDESSEEAVSDELDEPELDDDEPDEPPEEDDELILENDVSQ